MMEWSVEWTAETGSTNADLLAQAKDGAAEGLVLIADFQSRGRGRLDRTWIAPAGSALLVSVLLRPQLELSQMHLAVVAVALAAADAAESLTGTRPQLKWPNDLLGVAGDGTVAKLGGILAEAGPIPAPSPSPSPSPSSGAAGLPLVVGMGLNLHRPTDQPGELTSAAIYLDELSASPSSPSSPSSKRIEREQMVEVWLERLGHWYRHTASGDGRRQLIAAWKADLSTIGQQVKAQQQNRDVIGRAIDVTEDGALVIDTETGRVEVHAGDVIHLR